MEKLGIRRFVCETTIGVGESRGQGGFFYNYIAIPFFLGRMYADKETMEEYIKQSNLDWIIVRPGYLTDDAPTGKYKSGFSRNDKSIKYRISRIDVADFMLKQVSDDTYLRQTPGVSY